MVLSVPPQDNSTEAEYPPVYSVRIFQVSMTFIFTQINGAQNPGIPLPTYHTWLGALKRNMR